jgi:cytochrome oxidase Cu insertion factor (SCO1/SenC/PrrC family)
MVVLSFLATMLWIAMLIGFLVAVFWVIAVVVVIRGFKRWVHGDDQIKQIEEEEDLIDESLGR